MLIILKILLISFIGICGLSFNSFAVSEPSVSAASAVLIDGDTGEILYEKNAYQTRSMASTTKIMTALLAVESGKLTDIVKIDNPPLIEGTAVGFSSGDSVTLETLCYGMLLESGNDAALITAQFLAGSEADFSVLMNKKAQKIGMVNTNFVTSSGLDDSEHYTTAYDMALLGAYAVKNEKFAAICSTKKYRAVFLTPDLTRTFYNHNKLLGICDGVFGIKTGFTKKSGRCLVTACKRKNKLLVAVTLNAPDDWNDHKKLYTYGYGLYSCVTPKIELPEKIAVLGAEKAYMSISSKNEELTVRNNDELCRKVYLNKNIYAPINKNDVVGRIDFYSGNTFLNSMPILADEDISAKADAIKYKPSLFRRAADYIKEILNI